MKPLSLALSIEWDDCTVALSGGGVADAWLSAHQHAGHSGGAQASRDALGLVQHLLADAGRPLAAVEQFFFNAGPGAFTSLRIAAGLVQGLALPRQRPVGAIGSLTALAATVPAWHEAPHGTGAREVEPLAAGSGRAAGTATGGGAGAKDVRAATSPWLLCAALDARMSECYYAAFVCRAGQWPTPVLAPAVGTAEMAAEAFRRLRNEPLPGGQALAGLQLAGSGFGTGFDALQAFAIESGLDPQTAAGRRPDARAVLAVAQAVGAPPAGPARAALPHYVRDRVALDRDEQRQAAARREAARQPGGSPSPRS
ncbi:MAG: tRNA (adenosine(37)-N6)-threonylcarbamoyltransferase complex dimerization subunit type 1 TsaB [Lautropia sp.]|nr:tRNA (adenosine(37)-N6)-threonylcarbamoyltransferase complex dimerization subunit type 1 TsaB [Lautropia sp.]